MYVRPSPQSHIYPKILPTSQSTMLVSIKVMTDSKVKDGCKRIIILWESKSTSISCIMQLFYQSQSPEYWFD